MNLSRIAVKRPIATLSVLVVFLVVGLVSLWDSPLDLLPDIDPPVLAVVTAFPGSGPEETMDLVTEPVEEMASTVSGVTNIHSISQENVSIVILQFDWGTSVGDLRDDLNTQLELVSFPEGVEDPFILEFDPTLMPMMQISLSGMDDLPELTHEAEDNIVPHLETVPGVASVDVQGGSEEDLFVRLSPSRLEEENMAFDMLSDIIMAGLQDVPAGIQDIDDRSMRLRFLTGKSSIDKVRNLVVGFDMNEEKLKEMIGREINIDLNEQLATALEDLETEEPEEFPTRPVYLHEVTEDIKIDEDTNELIITFPVEEEEETVGDLLAIILDSFGEAYPQYDEWEEYQEQLPEEDWEDIDEEPPPPPEEWEEYEDEIPQEVWEEYQEQLPEEDWEDIDEEPPPPPEDMDSPEFTNFPRAGEEPGQIIIPITEEYEDITVSDVEEIQIYEIPDYEKWAEETRDNITTTLDETSKELEDAIVEVAASYIMAQADMGDNGMEEFLDEDEDLPLIPITLDSIADVKLDTHEATTIARINRDPSVNLIVQREGDTNTVEVARDVRSTMDEISKDFEADGGGELFYNYPLDQGREIEMALMDLAWSLFGGAFLAILVLLFFLKNWRTTLIIGLSIPSAIIFTFTILYFTDITINLMTLGALALAAGLLVDNAIVVSENVYRHLQMGKNPMDASIEGANEVAAAITASTLTTLSVFFPVVFLTGIAGELFTEFAITVACALFASLIISLTVIPLLTSLFLRLRSESEKETSRLPSYRFALDKALKYRWGVIAGAILFLIIGLFIFPRLGTDLFPIPEESSFVIEASLPPGTTLSDTDEFVKEIEDVLEEHDEKFEFYSSQVGDAGMFGLAGDTGESNLAEIRVSLDDDHLGEIDSVIETIRKETEDISDEAQLIFNRENIMDAAGMAMDMELDVIGDSIDKVQEVASDVVDKLSEVETLSDVRSLMEEDRPELHIDVDQEKAMERGVPPAQAGLNVREALEGREVTRIEEDGRLYELIVMYEHDELTTVEDIENLGVYTQMGDYVALAEIASISEGLGPLSIPREDQQTIGQVQAGYPGTDLDTATSHAMEAVDEMDLPEGYEVQPSGAFDMMEEAFDELELVLIIAAILVYLVMAAQFESLLYPFIIICTLPLAFTGTMIALLITGNSMSIPAMIGIIVLSGILVNDSIIMVDFINQQRRIHGLSLRKAIIEGATARLRPILMITITTILGLTPLAFGIGEGAEMQAPMAITVIGGQITGTILLLVVIPAIYMLVSKERRK